MPPLPADFSHTRVCKPFCEKSLTLPKAKQKEKILQNQISKLTRNARTHRLCTRAGMLESFLPNPELMTDDEVMIVLKIAFHQPAMKPVLEKLAAESEARKTLTE